MNQLTEAEAKLVAEVRDNASATGERDNRAPSDLRREQRRLLAIIDRLIGEPGQPSKGTER